MLKQLLRSIANFVKNKRMATVSLSVVAIIGIALFSSYKAGPAKNNTLVTGAPFNSGQTCAKAGCHGGGNFGGTITTQLIDTLTKKPVTSYTAGKIYWLSISMKKTTGKPKYGFQTTAANAAGGNVNAWGVAPAKTHNTLKSGHNYFEQSTALKSGTINIPWTGPAAGTGAITFYTSGNIVNGDGSTSGDQPVNTSLTVTQAPVAGIAAVAATEAKADIVSKPVYKLQLHSQDGLPYIMFSNGGKQQKVMITYTDIQGNPISTGTTLANQGDNIWPINAGKAKGFMIVNVVTADGARTSLKVVLNK